jgi:hypothetical protein
MKNIITILMLALVLSGSAFAMQPSIIGGIRDGLALGMMIEGPLARNVGFRIGAEGNTGKQPLVAFAGGKFYLGNVGYSSFSFGLGAVVYAGNNKTDVGIAISAIFNNLMRIKPLFLEVGIDVAGPGRLQAQLGYKLY